MTSPDARPWWQTGVVYQIYPRAFMDASGDGVGDLDGVRQRLDHLVWLGVDALWLSPFYPSPGKDGGYDVADYCDVDPHLGDLAAFDRLVAEAHARGLRVIVDWVPNHSSDQHPWFVESRASRDSDAPRLVPLARSSPWRRPARGASAQQLAERLRRPGVDVGRLDRAVLPPLVPPGAARPQLALARLSARRCTPRSASGWIAAWTASASTWRTTS